MSKIKTSERLIDGSNKEIMCGDIISECSPNDYNPCIVYYDNDFKKFYMDNYHSSLSIKESITENSKIIGNIYDNPELQKNI
jgi:hypothetical protein